MACAVSFANLPARAQTGPTIAISWTKTLVEYDPYNPGPERSITYTLRNTSAADNTNSIISLVFPTGIDAGLFYVGVDDILSNWVIWYGGNATLLGTTNNPIAPGASTAVEIRTESLFTRLDYVTAYALGTVPVSPIMVEAPVPAPSRPVLGQVSLATNSVGLTATNLSWGYSYTLEQAGTVSGWTNVLTFWATNGLTQALTVPQPAGSRAQFYQLRSP